MCLPGARAGSPPGRRGTLRRHKNLLEWLRKDPNLAGIPFEDESGRRVDAHALRHTYGTLLSQAGVDPKTLKDLMRHSSITTTYGFYIHGSQGRMKDAVGRLPEPMPTPGQTPLRTGTAG